MMKRGLLKVTSFATMALAAAFISVLPETSMALSGKDFEYHGYFRAGVGTTDKGGDQICIVGPDSVPWTDPGVKWVGRLGNECDTYLETVLVGNHVQAKTEKDAGFRSQITLAYKTPGHTTWEQPYVNVVDPADPSVTVGKSSGDQVKVREAYVEASNALGFGEKLWVGDRFYREGDVHILDWWYWAATMGYGAGFEKNTDIGTLKLAFLRSQNGPTSTDNGDLGLSMWDARLLNVRIGDMIGLHFRLAVGQTPDAQKGTDKKDGTSFCKQKGNQCWESASNTAMGLKVDLNLPGMGWNQISYQSGSGTLAGIDNLYAGAKAKGAEDQSSVWIVDHLYLEFGPLTVNGAVALTKFDNGDKDKKDPKTRKKIAAKNEFSNTSIVIRPVYTVNDTVSVAAEFGQATSDAEWKKDQLVKATGKMADFNGQTVQKFTIAPQVQAGKGYWTRPVLRMFWTKFAWNENVKQANQYTDGGRWPGMTTSDFANAGSARAAYEKEDGASVWGFQTEVWW